MGRKFAIALIVTGVVVAAVASGASSSERSALRGEGAESCVVDLDRLDDPQVCYESFADAVYAVTGGEIDLPAGADGSDLSNADVTASRRALRREGDIDDLDRDGNVISGVLWIDKNLSGESRVFVGSNCRHGHVNNVRGLFARDFNDVASSAKGYSNCDVNLFEDVDFEGAKLACEPRCPGLGVLNDEVSSVRFKKN